MLKVVHVEDKILNLYPIIQNRNDHPSEKNNCGEEYIIVLLDGKNLCETIIYKITYIRRNNITESRDLVLSYLHIGGTKYSI